MKRVSGSWKELEIYLQPIRHKSKMNPALPFPRFRQRLEPVPGGGAELVLSVQLNYAHSGDWQARSSDRATLG